jgi:hypothetical protein
MMLSPELPAIVLAFLTWLQAPPTSLAEAARKEALRRSLVGQSTRALTNSDLPDVPLTAQLPPGAPPPDPETTAAGEPPATGEPPAGEKADEKAEKKDEQWWRNRITSARQAIDRNKVLAEALQSRINALLTDFVNRDDPAQRMQLQAERIRALAELERVQKDIEQGGVEVQKILDEARRLGVPPGWLR